jgi:glycosyltransferase involved in cell wall biosynthesis
MPVFNYARHLRDAIASLRAQTFQDWECIIVDDGSTDDTPNVLRKLASEEPRILILRQENAGPAIARNTALAATTGTYVQFLDADDLLAPDKLSLHVAAMEALPEVDLVYGSTAYFDDGHPDVLREGFRPHDDDVPPRVRGSGQPVLDILLERNVITIEAPLTRKSAFDEVGVFDRELRRITDWHFWLRCAIAGKRFEFLPSDSPVALIRVHDASFSHDETIMRLVEIEMRRKLAASLPAGNARDRNSRLLAHVSAETGINLALSGQLSRGLRLLLPATASQRQRSWLVWSMALLASPLPGVRRRLAARRYGRQDRVAAA